MRYTFVFIGMTLLLTACGPSDTKVQRAIVGSWSQGSHILTLSSNGAYTSTFPGLPQGQTTTYEGKWSIKSGRLILSDVRSNAVAASDSDAKILSLDEHRLDLDAVGQKISLTR